MNETVNINIANTESIDYPIIIGESLLDNIEYYSYSRNDLFYL